jgi:hypothetical protein
MPNRFHRASRAGTCAALLSLAVPASFAQVESQGHGLLTLGLGQASAPYGNVAAGVAAGSTSVPTTTAHSIAWRIVGGYQFFDYMSGVVGISYANRLHSSAPYLGTDEITAITTISIIEAAVVAHVPLAKWVRVDLTGGAAVTASDTPFGTRLGSSLPLGQSADVHVRKFGATGGVDLEWRMSEVWSLIVGDHFYPGVGSASTVGAGHGTVSILYGGVNITF